MKILFINNLYYPNRIGGAEISVQLLAEGLQKLKVEPIIVTTAPHSHLDQINGIKVYYIKIRNLYWPFGNKPLSSFKKAFWHLLDTYNPLMKLTLSRVIKEERPDLVHTHNLAGISVSAWQLVKHAGLPLVHTIHDHYLLCPKSIMFRNYHNCAIQCLDCRLFSLSKRFLSPAVDHVVSISQFLLARHSSKGYFTAAHKSVLYNPILPRKLESKDIIQRPLRFGYIGHLNQAKGVDFLLKIFDRIDVREASLSLAGSGEPDYVASLQKRYDKPNIEFLGFVPSDELYERINVLIVPSLLHEGLGMVVLEAQSHGIPVIGSKRGGIPELIEDGKTGFLFDPEIPGDLESQINKLIQEPDLIAGMAPACLKVNNEFGVEVFCQKHLMVYRSLLS